jgi:hypothetical protein
MGTRLKEHDWLMRLQLVQVVTVPSSAVASHRIWRRSKLLEHISLKRQAALLPFYDDTHHKHEKLSTASAVCYLLQLLVLEHFRCLSAAHEDHRPSAELVSAEVPCPVRQLQTARSPSLHHDRVRYSSSQHWSIVLQCHAACLATRCSPSAGLHRPQRLSGWDDCSMRRGSHAPGPGKDSCGSDLPKGLHDGSRQSPSFVAMSSMTHVVGPEGRQEEGEELGE